MQTLDKTLNVQGWREKLAIVACFLAGIGIPLTLAVENIAAGLMVVCFVITPALWRELGNVIRRPYVMACLILFILLIIGASYTSVPAARVIWMLEKKREFLFVPLLFSVCLIPRARHALLSGFGLGVLVSVLVSILSALLDRPWMKAVRGDWAVFQTHTYHNYFVSLVICALLCYWLSGKLDRRAKWFAGIVMALGIVDVLFLVSGRTGQLILLFLIALPLLLWRWRTGLLATLAGALIVVPALLFFSHSIRNGVDQAQSDLSGYEHGQSQTSVGLRLDFYRTSLRLIAEKPLLGHGTGSFVQEYQRVSGWTEGDRAAKNPHNDYFWFGVELGLVGVLALIGIMVGVLVEARGLAAPERWMAICLSLSMGMATLANSFFMDNLTGLGFALLACALLAYKTNNPQELSA